ncbi:hypothetical protein NL676_008560 [Syzygium grande]|nr:hypothetical protein NL676_008560 [Syzygium grande]
MVFAVDLAMWCLGQNLRQRGGVTVLWSSRKTCETESKFGEETEQRNTNQWDFVGTGKFAGTACRSCWSWRCHGDFGSQSATWRREYLLGY